MREQFADWDQVASLTQQELADVIRKAGLANQKAKSILAVLKEIKNRFGDYTLEPLRKMEMEDARRWLLSLPGVGPKTAAIVLCFSFGKPAIPVDTHVFRVSWRLGIIDKKIGESKAHGALEAVVPNDLAFRFHTALIQHGRQTCKAPKPNCERCVVRRVCRFYRDNLRSSAKK
jgi:endonuclease-3